MLSFNRSILLYSALYNLVFTFSSFPRLFTYLLYSIFLKRLTKFCQVLAYCFNNIVFKESLCCSQSFIMCSFIIPRCFSFKFMFFFNFKLVTFFATKLLMCFLCVCVSYSLCLDGRLKTSLMLYEGKFPIPQSFLSAGPHRQLTIG